MTQSTAQIRHVVDRSGFANPLTLGVLVEDADYLKVYADDGLLQVGIDYTVLGIGDANGVSIEIIGGEDVNEWVGVETFTALYDPPLQQGSDLSLGGTFGRAFEAALDAQSRQLQALSDRVDRAIKLHASTTDDGDVVAVADHVIGFDENGELALLAISEDNVYPAVLASAVTFTPVGGISATTVQAALTELDSEKLGGALGSTDNRLLRADGTGGKTAQASAVTVDDSGNVDGVGTLTTTGAVTITSNNGLVVNASTAAPVLQARRSDTPSVGRTIGYIDIEERDTAGTLTDATVRLAGESTSVTPGAVSGQLIVQTLQAGSAGQRMVVGAGVFHPSATGGDKGNNTINFGAVYDDNVLLSCYVFDAALEGTIDLDKWDALVPGERRHEDARRFAARLGTDTDPLDIDSYIAHWRKKRHLTALPNEANFDPQQGMPTGAWIQRLIETVETQAVHLAQLHERLKALEKS